VIKNWDTTLKAIKMLLKFVMTSTPKVIKFITPILAWLISPAPEDALDAGGVTRKTPLIWGYAKKL
jgi:hypothetical protein